MQIRRLQSLTDAQLDDIQVLMRELSASIAVTSEMIRRAVESPDTHFFALMEDDGRIIGTASLCVFHSPTGSKAHIEDVVVLSSYRGRHLGKMLMEHLIEYARKEFKEIDLSLTSRPQRVAANQLYKSLGFCQRETNVYSMAIRPIE